MNQVFISIFLPKNTRSRKIYRYKFSGKQACLSEGALVWQCAKPRPSLKHAGLNSVPSFGHAQKNVHPPLGRPKEMTILPWVCSMKWDNVGLTNMSNPRYLDLDLTISQFQDNVGLTNILDPRYLGLAIHQVQDNVSLVNIPDLRHLNFIVQHV